MAVRLMLLFTAAALAGLKACGVKKVRPRASVWTDAARYGSLGVDATVGFASTLKSAAEVNDVVRYLEELREISHQPQRIHLAVALGLLKIALQLVVSLSSTVGQRRAIYEAGNGLPEMPLHRDHR